MKRFLGSLGVIVGVLCIGLIPARAAEPNVLLISDTQESQREQIIIIASPKAFSDPLFYSLLSTYGKPFVSSFFVDTTGLRNLDQDARPAAQVVGADEPDTQPARADGVRVVVEPPVMGATGGITSEQDASATQPTTSTPSSSDTQPSVTTQPTPVPSPTTLQLIELYPNTTGDDKLEEYINIKNVGEAPVELSGWTVKDALGKTFAFDQMSLAPNVTYQLLRTQSNIALNNDTDTISLIAPDLHVVDAVAYEKPKQGDRLMRQDEVWRWSSDPASATETNAGAGAHEDQAQTPDTSQPANQPIEETAPVVITDAPIAQPEVVSLPNSPPASPPATIPAVDQPSSYTSSAADHSIVPHTLMISQAKQLEDDTPVEIHGIASVSPGILGKQFFYISDESGGVQIYKYDADFPAITVGTPVVVHGIMSTSATERRVKVDKTGSISTQADGPAPDAMTKRVSELETNDIASLARVEGILVTTATDHMQIESEGVALEVAIASYTNIDSTAFHPGDELIITGIVRPFGDKLKLTPRSQQDIVVKEKPAPVASTATMGTGKQQGARTD
ncbi:lamin tail domain-containing protein [Candidatus Uhrbacteria bacterium]|nr:lamin tail domain-containing protein [Candidatus Uhrbacteria bacterium]